VREILKAIIGVALLALGLGAVALLGVVLVHFWEAVVGTLFVVAAAMVLLAAAGLLFFKERIAKKRSLTDGLWLDAMEGTLLYGIIGTVAFSAWMSYLLMMPVWAAVLSGLGVAAYIVAYVFAARRFWHRYNNAMGIVKMSLAERWTERRAAKQAAKEAEADDEFARLYGFK
jgi:uncharacterized membrane protein